MTTRSGPAPASATWPGSGSAEVVDRRYRTRVLPSPALYESLVDLEAHADAVLDTTVLSAPRLEWLGHAPVLSDGVVIVDCLSIADAYSHCAGFVRPVSVYAVEGARGAGLKEPATSPPPVADAGPLTDREREVVNLSVQGCTNREIADALVIAEGTAVWHVANILSKLNLHLRAQVAVWAVQRTQPSTH